ncbi:uncharacterized protein LOC134270676 isoform X2 [Saccostrea cucullata]
MGVSTPFYEIRRNSMKLQMMHNNRSRDIPVTLDAGPGLDRTRCELENYRLCADGSCISQVDLCPEEQLMNQNTILIMIVVGLAVVIFLIVLYCFQQRNRSPSHVRGRSVRSSGTNDEADRVSLFLPPPTYDEVITTNLYPPTPQILQRRDRIASSEEPMTPPPNYDTALILLSRSHESVLSPKYEGVPKRPAVSNGHRRSLSVDQLSPNSGDTSVQIFQYDEIAEPNPDKTNLNTISEVR